ncbi:type IV secretory system conjugative DNA transfer family protein [Chloroflexota bacterium]
MIELGINIEDDSSVQLNLAERRQGTYIIGTTGTGKSTLLKNIILNDMLHDRKHGICLLDPHGDLIDELLGLVPENRINDVILFDPMDIKHPFGLNLLECDRNDPHQVRWVISTVMATLQRLFYYSWGVRLEDVLRNSLETALLLPDSTFIELLLLLRNKVFRSQVVEKIDDELIQQFWKDLPHGHTKQMEIISSTINKISPFVTDKSMRNIIGQPKNTVNLKQTMDEGKILFVNLSKGDLGEANSALLGSVLVNQILIAALQRRSIPYGQRREFHLVVDEFQNFATESFAILQSEARKYAVDVAVAHQFRDQLDHLNKGSTLNVGNIVIFRVTGRDSYELASQFDNSPPPPDSRVEPVYQDYEYKGIDFLVESKLQTGEGKLHQEVDLPRRPYNDVEAEMANRLSVLPNYHAWCRVIYDPKSRNEPGSFPSLSEHKIRTRELEKEVEELKRDDEEKMRVSNYIRERSRKLARTQEEVEKDIKRRTRGLIDTEYDIPAVEKIE